MAIESLPNESESFEKRLASKMEQLRSIGVNDRFVDLVSVSAKLQKGILPASLILREIDGLISIVKQDANL